MKHFVFQLRNLPWEILIIFFQVGKKALHCLLAFLFWNNFKRRTELLKKYSLYPSPRPYHICFISAFPETSENWLRRSEPLSPWRHAGENKDGLPCILLYNCSSVIKSKRSNWDSHMDYTKARTRISTVAPVTSSTENPSLHSASNPEPGVASTCHISDLL